jgi:hypothetical protein
VDSEAQIAAARVYIAGRHDGAASELVPVPDATARSAPSDYAAEAQIAGAGQWLELAPTADGLDLRSASGAVFGRLAYLSGGDRLAQTADGEYRLAFERNHGSWAIVARDDHDMPLAAFYRGWRTGGDIWLSPDEWLTLRWTPLRRGGSWRLTADGAEVLRLEPSSADHLELLVGRVPARAALLILLVCQIVMTETVPLRSMALGEGGGFELAMVAP